jgi:solute carrier family 39 (zinc transporter), member 1/2/3
MVCLIPLFLSNQTLFKVPKIFFFVIKYVGSGVIIATAFIHLLAPSIAALYSPCLDPDSVITQYPWAEGICLITVLAMFFVELCAPHHRPSGIDKDRDYHTGAGGTSALDSVEGTNRDVEAEVGTTGKG